MTPRVLILYTRNDTANADVVRWIKATLDEAGLPSELSDDASPGSTTQAMLLVVPLAGYGWRAITDRVVRPAVDVGVPVLALADRDGEVLWPALQEMGALDHALRLPDRSPQSAARLVAAAKARIQTTPLDLTVSLYASPGLEDDLQRVRDVMSDSSLMFGDRVAWRSLAGADIAAPTDAVVCLLWHDVHTVLGGNAWAIDEWQTLDDWHALVCYRRRPPDADMSFEDRLGRIGRQTSEAELFVERSVGPGPGSPAYAGRRSKAGYPPADFERQLRAHLSAAVVAAVARGRQPRQPRLVYAWDRAGHIDRDGTMVPGRFVVTGGSEAEFRDGEADHVEPSTHLVSQAHLAAFAPAAVEAGRPFPLQIWVCAPGSYPRMLRLVDDGAAAAVRASGVARAPYGGKVFDVEVDAPSCVIEPTRDGVIWIGEPASALFTLTAAAGASVAGVATVSLWGVPFARLWFEIPIGAAPDELRDVSLHEQRVSKIFASYATEDRDSVARWVHGAGVAGVDVVSDVLARRESSDWSRELFATVPEADVFCLFWSAHARASRWVSREWQCARAARGTASVYIVPLDHPRLLPPPPDLEARREHESFALVRRYERLRALIGAE